MKRPLALIIACFMMLSIVSCSKNEDVVNSSAVSSVSGASDAAAEVTPAGNAASGEEDSQTGEFSSFVSKNYCSISTEDPTAMFITLNGNGSVEGQSYEYRSDETSEEYDAGTIYGNIFNFNLSNLTAIDDNSYSADVSSITYTYEANTEDIDEITSDDATFVHVRNVYTAPLDGVSNSKVIIYDKSMAIVNMPEEIKPYLDSFGLDTKTDGALLDTVVLYFEAAGVAFVLVPS